MIKAISLYVTSMTTLVAVQSFVITSRMYMVIFAVSINLLMAIIPPAFIYCLIRYPKFADWIKDLIEGGDSVPNKDDAKDAVILFFAYMVGWLVINLFIGWGMFGEDWATVTSGASIVFLALLGLSQIHFKKNGSH
jgi:hypothetical protein